jgi:hypothetical protein
MWSTAYLMTLSHHASKKIAECALVQGVSK